MPPVAAIIPEIIAGLGSLLPTIGTAAAAAAPEIAAGAGAEAAALPLELGTAGGLASGAGLGTALESAAALGPLASGVDLGGVAGLGAGLGEAAGAAPLAFTVNALPATAAGLGGADLAGALGAGGLALGADALAGGGPAFQPPPGAPLTPQQTITADFAQLGTPQPLSFSASAPTPGGGMSAAGAAAPDVGGAPTIGPNTAPFLPSGLPNYAAYPEAGGITLPGGGAGGGGGGLMDFIAKNPGLAATLGIGTLGTLAGPKLAPLLAGKLPQQAGLEALRSQEQSIAAQQAGYGTQLQQPLLTGQLPSGAEQSVKNAVHDAITTTKARYANLGLSGSTMEQDALNNIQNQATAQRFAIAQQMAQTGIAATGQAANALGLQDQVYTQLMNAQIQQDTALQNAIARFASAAALGTGLASRG